MQSSHNQPAFALDPTLPWLRTDPAMQEPGAFHYYETLELHQQPWEPMARYFPGGATLAMRRITSFDQLVEGAAYYHRHAYYEASQQQMRTVHIMGRYTGLTPTSNPKRQARNLAKGVAHLELEADELECPLRDYWYRENGTRTQHVDLTDKHHALYQLTHYVNLPACYLAQLGLDAARQAGLTLRQACWLRQEQEVAADAAELTAQTSLGGVLLPAYRVVLPKETLEDFWIVQERVGTLTPSEAKRRKSGAVAITYRMRNALSVRYLTQTEYYKLEDATLLLDWLRTHSEAQHARLEAAVIQQQVHQSAQVIRAQRRAELQATEAERALAKAQQLAADLQRGTLSAGQHEYAGLEEIALAA